MAEPERQDWRSRAGYLPLFLGIAAIGGLIGALQSQQWLAGVVCLFIVVAMLALSWHLYDRPRWRRSRPRQGR